MTVEDLVLFFTEFDVMAKTDEEGGGVEGGGETKDGTDLLTVESLHTLLWNLFFLPHGGKHAGGSQPLHQATMATGARLRFNQSRCAVV